MVHWAHKSLLPSTAGIISYTFIGGTGSWVVSVINSSYTVTSIGSAAFAPLAQHTDHATSDVCRNKPHLCAQKRESELKAGVGTCLTVLARRCRLQYDCSLVRNNRPRLLAQLSSISRQWTRVQGYPLCDRTTALDPSLIHDLLFLPISTIESGVS